MPSEGRVRKASEFRPTAMHYVDDELAIIAKYGSAPVLSPAEYYGLVEEIERVARKIWTSSGGVIEEA